MRVIGVVGEIGSGKDEVLKYLKAQYGVPYVSVGDFVRRIAENEGIEPTRENLEVISEKCLQEEGGGCFVRMAAEEILNQGWEIAGISGIRSPEDVEIMKNLFGDNFILINVEIRDPGIRFERVRRRGEERDPLTYDQFLIQDREEEEVFRISQTGALADYSLNNDGTPDDLHRQIELLRLVTN